MDIDKIIETRLTNTRQTLIDKAKQYARKGRLGNFHDIAELMETTPEAALLTLASKHIVALKDYVLQPKNVPMEQWEEKIGDIICYMCLLEVMVKQKSQNCTYNNDDKTVLDERTDCLDSCMVDESEGVISILASDNILTMMPDGSSCHKLAGNEHAGEYKIVSKEYDAGGPGMSAGDMYPPFWKYDCINIDDKRKHIRLFSHIDRKILERGKVYES